LFCTGVLVILALLFLTFLFNYIPDASLAAVIISAVYDLIDFSLLAKLWRVNSMYTLRVRDFDFHCDEFDCVKYRYDR